MIEKRKLTIDEATSNGVTTNHEQMPNGEYRYRMMMQDGSGAIITVAGDTGEWQKSHYHTGVREIIVVQTGWMAIAEFDNLVGLVVSVLRAGEHIVSRPNVHHNVYMSAGTVTYCVKSGTTAAEKASGQPDWHASPKVDELTRHLTEEEILALAVQ